MEHDDKRRNQLIAGQHVIYSGNIKRYRNRVGLVEKVFDQHECIISIQHRLVWTYTKYLTVTTERLFMK